MSIQHKVVEEVTGRKMANFVCRTCLYVCANKFSFKPLEGVMPILELFIPEIKIYVGKYLLICNQCYFFLKNVERFKANCLATQNKLYSMNLLTIKNSHEAILQPVITKQKKPSTFYVNPKKAKPNSTVTSTSDITLTSLLKTAPKPTATENINESSAGNLLDLLSLPSEETSQSTSTVSDLELIMNYNDDPVEEELVAVRNDDISTVINEDFDDDEVEIVNVASPNGGESSSTETVTSSSTEDNFFASVKTEKATDHEENPGFFNKKSVDGFYKCRLCKKMYRNSKRLYNHTKEKHADQVKFHHCDNCSFFTIWKSALVRHCSIFHEDILERNNPLVLSCYHCSFQSKSKDLLSQHIFEKHRQEKYTRCPFCRGRFSDNISFAKHVEKEHLDLDMAISSNYCSDCGVLFLTEEDYSCHVNEKHQDLICVLCNKTCESKAGLLEHRRSVHATSFGASALP